MNYEPTNWQTGDLITAGKLNNIEQGIAALYPQETIIAPEQTVTITAETDPETGVPITLAEGIDLPESLPDNWTVVVDGGNIPYVYRGERGAYEIGGESYYIGVFAQDGGLHLIMVSIGDDPSSAAPMVGDHTVKITQTVLANPTVKAFPVSAGSGNVLWVINAPKEDVDAAKANGCVLLYPAAPSNSIGFAFGMLVGSIAYYAALANGSFGWHADTVTLKNGKYVITDLS